MPDIRVDNVSFTYAGGSQPVLHSIQCTISEGEFVLLAGPSGCGKSTLALSLAGLIPSRIAGSLTGEIYLGERKMSGMGIYEVAQHIGMVFQNPDEQLVHIDVESEVAFGPENLALPQVEIERRISDALRYTNMEHMRKEEIFALSGGQKQRVAIAAMLAMQSRVLVLDEPTSDLDPVGTQEVMNVLRTLNKQYGWTIVLVEHKIDEVIPWVDRVVLMEAGRIILDAPPREAFADLAPWQRLGVAVPQMVQLAHELPDAFVHGLPLSVDEAYEVLRDTSYACILQQRAGLPISERNGVTSSTDQVLSWKDVHLAYGEKAVLRDVSLNIYEQEWVALVGANGAGKTSLASLAMGFQAPTSGTIRYQGRPVKPGKISQQAEKMAYLFQSADKMLFTPTVEQELLFGLKHQRKSRSNVSYDIHTLLEVIDLVAARKMNPFHLSHGQRKRLAIGTLLARYPHVLILDEPTTGQDLGHAEAFLEFLQQLRKKEQLTYLMITHNMESVARYATRMIVLNNAQIVLDGHPSEVFAHVEDLAAFGILPPSIAQLHARLCNNQIGEVALSVHDFIQALKPIEALS
jgi:energy-coupling factor transport system ATP-binding protein